MEKLCVNVRACNVRFAFLKVLGTARGLRLRPEICPLLRLSRSYDTTMLSAK